MILAKYVAGGIDDAAGADHAGAIGAAEARHQRILPTSCAGATPE
jgi:hypothetical protein